MTIHLLTDDPTAARADWLSDIKLVTDETIYEGDIVAVMLKELASAGYLWQPSGKNWQSYLMPMVWNENPSQIQQKEFTETVMVGGGNWKRFFFIATEAGETTLSFQYLRPWEKAPPPQQIFEPYIIIKP